MIDLRATNIGSIQMLTNTVFLAVTMVVIFLSVIAYDMFNYFYV